MSTSRRFEAGQLHAVTRHLLEAAGTPRPIARVTAQVLVGANVVGHDSHGVLHMPRYLTEIEKGELQPAAEPQVVKETPVSLVIEGHEGHGHYGARWGMERAIKKAKESGACTTSFASLRHMGRLGEYAEMAARAGCIGLITYGTARAGGGSTLPYGGRRGAFGTNPIAVGAPTGDRVPFIMDFATSKIAVSKVFLARNGGKDLPPDCIVDKDGNPSTNPDDYGNGGYLAGFGEHKGFAIGLLTFVLGGLSGNINAAEGWMNGTLMQVIDVEAFLPLQTYQQGLRATLDGIKETPPAEGFDEVQVPGDFESCKRAERLAGGIEVPGPIVDQLVEWGEKLGVDVDGVRASREDTDIYRDQR